MITHLPSALTLYQVAYTRVFAQVLLPNRSLIHKYFLGSNEGEEFRTVS